VLLKATEPEQAAMLLNAAIEEERLGVALSCYAAAFPEDIPNG
jgi:hypothetical protein